MSNWILSSSVLIGIILAVRRVFRGRISPRLQYALWLLVMLRLLLPVNFGQSAASIMNYLPAGESHVLAQSLAENDPVPTAPEKPAAVPNLPVQNDRPGLSQSPATPGNVQTPAALPVQENVFDAARLLGGLWLLGIAVVLLCLLISNFRFALRLRRSCVPADPYQSLPVYECAWLETPCMFGLLRPAIYLSPGLTGDSRDYALRHEYGHFRQGDHLWALFRGLCLALHWYNPLVWLAARLSKRDGELACDQRVTRSLTEAQRLDYGRTLICLSCSDREPVFCAATTMSVKGKALKQRIEYIAKRPTMLLSTVIILLLAVILSVGCTFTGAKEESPAAPTPEATMPEEAPPTASPTPAVTPGRLLDRTGQLLDLSQYPELSTAEESFAIYLQMGCDVRLTIDLALQQQAQTMLAETLGYGDGAVVMVDVKTGAPLVIASNRPDRSPALLSAYQPTNLFLPCTAIAALDSNIITTEDQICCEGVFDRYEADGYAPACWIWTAGELTHGNENMTTALRDSCDCYFYALGNDLGNDLLVDCAESLGLGQPTGIELPETTGIMASRRTPLGTGEEWRIGDSLEAAAGRSTSAFTPLQMAEYCAAIANKGQRYSASILGSVTDGDRTVRYTRQPQVIGSVLEGKEQEANWAAIHQGMYAALNDWSMNDNNAHIWQDCPWQVAGMANRIPLGNHAPYEDQVPCRGLFMGFAPYENPQVAIFVVTEEAESYASQQIARQLLDFYIEKST